MRDVIVFIAVVVVMLWFLGGCAWDVQWKKEDGQVFSHYRCKPKMMGYECVEQPVLYTEPLTSVVP